MSTIARRHREQTVGNPLPKGLVIAGLVAALYGPLLTQMWLQWWQDRTTSHGFVVPLSLVSGCTSAGTSCGRFRLSQQPGLSRDAGRDRAPARGDLGAELFISRSSLPSCSAG